MDRCGLAWIRATGALVDSSPREGMTPVGVGIVQWREGEPVATAQVINNKLPGIQAVSQCLLFFPGYIPEITSTDAAAADFFVSLAKKKKKSKEKNPQQL